MTLHVSTHALKRAKERTCEGLSVREMKDAVSDRTLSAMRDLGASRVKVPNLGVELRIFDDVITTVVVPLKLEHNEQEDALEWSFRRRSPVPRAIRRAITRR